MKKIIAIFVMAILVYGTAQAQSRYSTWSDPNNPTTAGTENLGKMVDELRQMVDEAERARAADPQFLRDLKSLADKYGGAGPLSHLLFSDDFSDGDYTRNPVWTVTSGKYWIEKGYGLRSFIEAGASNTSSQSQSSSQKLSKEELLIGVLGAVLGGKVQNQQDQTSQNNTNTLAQAAEIYLSQSISNAFRLEFDLASWVAGGHFEIGPYQGNNRNTGYRLVYQSGQSPALQLVRHYASSSAVVGSYKNLKLEDQKSHKLIWQRDANGRTKVSMDGALLMDVTDRSFRDPFSGLVVQNNKGDFTVKTIKAFGN